jgi:hypothetical protein
LKNYIIAVCAALLLTIGTAAAQQNSNSVTGIKETTAAKGNEASTPASDDSTESADLKKHATGSFQKSWRPQADSDDDWHFEIAPYLWAAALKGDLRVRNSTARVDASFSDIFHNLDFSFATRVEAGKKRWRVLIDENYVNLGTTGTGPLGETIDVQPTLNFFEVAGSYELATIRNKNSTANEPLPPTLSLEVLGGLRYTHFGLGLQRGTNPAVEGSRNLVDFFAGNRVKVRPHPAFTIIGKYTLGGGGSHFAWTVSALGDFRFRRNMSAWGGYQVLDMDADQASNTVGFNGKLQGLIFGLSFYK